MSDNNDMAGAHRGNLCAIKQKSIKKQKRAPGGRATAQKVRSDNRERTFVFMRTRESI